MFRIFLFFSGIRNMSPSVNQCGLNCFPPNKEQVLFLNTKNFFFFFVIFFANVRILLHTKSHQILDTTFIYVYIYKFPHCQIIVHMSGRAFVVCYSMFDSDLWHLILLTLPLDFSNNGSCIRHVTYSTIPVTPVVLTMRRRPLENIYSVLIGRDRP